MRCPFTVADGNTTRYEYKFEYVHASWVMQHMMNGLFPGKFRTRGEKWMRQFKALVESTQ